MKYLCITLSLFVVLLSVNPCCIDSNCKAESSVNTAGKASKDKGCSGCSSFFTCGTCAGFITPKQVIFNVVQPPQTPATHFISYKHPHIQVVTLAIWQPPQLG